MAGSYPRPAAAYPTGVLRYRHDAGPVVFSRWLDIGWASAPYDPVWARNYPGRSALMALAGPLSNLPVVMAAGILIHIGIAMDLFYAPDHINFPHVVAARSAGFPDGVATRLSSLFSLNVLLSIFNPNPLPPLDGSGVIPLPVNKDNAVA